MDYRLELVIVPVSDVDRAKAFYIEVAHAELAGRGLDVSEIRHMTPEGWKPGVDPARSNYGSYSGFSDPDGNEWLLQEAHNGKNS